MKGKEALWQFLLSSKLTIKCRWSDNDLYILKKEKKKKKKANKRKILQVWVGPQARV